MEKNYSLDNCLNDALHKIVKKPFWKQVSNIHIWHNPNEWNKVLPIFPSSHVFRRWVAFYILPFLFFFSLFHTLLATIYFCWSCQHFGFIRQAIVEFSSLWTTIMVDLSPKSQIYVTYKCDISYYFFHYSFLCRIFPFFWNLKFITPIKEISKYQEPETHNTSLQSTNLKQYISFLKKNFIVSLDTFVSCFNSLSFFVVACTDWRFKFRLNSFFVVSYFCCLCCCLEDLRANKSINWSLLLLHSLMYRTM